ncbi:RICIN domain-containing protein [Bacillus thuringiensis]|nr:RICIN domain-containing protein [Bacillus thuringiensis]
MNIFGWDIVYASTNDSVNKQLKKYMDENEITFTYTDENTCVTLTFDNWEIVSGGSSKLLRMKTLIKAGELIFMGKSTTLDGICPLLEIQLGFLQDKKRSNIQKLAFNFLLEGQKEGDQTEGAVTLINPDLNNVFEQGSIIYAVLKASLAELFIQNKDKVSYTFAELNISPDSSWMQPKKYKYSYYSPTSDKDKGLLTIFSVVTNRDISELDEKIDSTILDQVNDSFLILSERLFLENIVLPEFPNTFGFGANKDDFFFEKTSPTSGVIKNNKNLKYAPITVGAIDYHPIIESLQAKIEGEKLHISFSGECDISPGAYIEFTAKATYTLYYDSNNQKIQFNVEDTDVRTENHIPWWIWISIIGGTTVSIIAGELASALTKDFKINSNASISKFKGDVVNWGSMQQEEITDCVLEVAFGIKGRVPIIISGKTNKIKTALNDKSVVEIDDKDTNNIILWEDKDSNNQVWDFVYDKKGHAYQIRSKTRLDYTLTWKYSASDPRVVIERNIHAPEQDWLLEDCGDGYYIIKNKKDPNMVLDVDHSATANGTKIQVYPRNNRDNQKFKLTPPVPIFSPGNYRIGSALDDTIVLETASRKELVSIVLKKGKDEYRETLDPLYMWEYVWNFEYDENLGAYQIKGIGRPDYVLTPLNSARAVRLLKNDHHISQYWYVQDGGDGHYVISNLDNGETIDLSASQGSDIVRTDSRNRGDGQKLKLRKDVSDFEKKASIDDGTYNIITYEGDEELLFTFNGEAAIPDFNLNTGEKNQQWNFVYDRYRDAYLIKNISNEELVLTAALRADGSTDIAARISGIALKGEQYWYLEDCGNEYYMIRSAIDPSKVLAIALFGSVEEGSFLTLQEPTNLGDELKTFKIKKSME